MFSHSSQFDNLTIDISNYVLIKIVESWYIENTYLDKSNKTSLDIYFFRNSLDKVDIVFSFISRIHDQYLPLPLKHSNHEERKETEGVA